MVKNKFGFFLLFVGLFISTQTKAQKTTDSTMKKQHRAEFGSFYVGFSYGGPSIIRAFVKKSLQNGDYTFSGAGPFMFKTEYKISKKIGVGINAYYNISDVSIIDEGRDSNYVWGRYTYGAQIKELSANLRVNYHFLLREHWDLYAGLGLGYGKINFDSYSEAPVPSYSISFQIPKPYSYEATAGARYFIGKHFNINAELGMGRAWLLYKRFFLPEAVIQGGLSWRF